MITITVWIANKITCTIFIVCYFSKTISSLPDILLQFLTVLQNYIIFFSFLCIETVSQSRRKKKRWKLISLCFIWQKFSVKQMIVQIIVLLLNGKDHQYLIFISFWTVFFSHSLVCMQRTGNAFFSVFSIHIIIRCYRPVLLCKFSQRFNTSDAHQYTTIHTML